LLVLYSDGVIEAANSSVEEFAEDRLIAAVESGREGEPGEICSRILHSYVTSPAAKFSPTTRPCWRSATPEPQ